MAQKWRRNRAKIAEIAEMAQKWVQKWVQKLAE